MTSQQNQGQHQFLAVCLKKILSNIWCFPLVWRVMNCWVVWCWCSIGLMSYVVLVHVQDVWHHYDLCSVIDIIIIFTFYWLLSSSVIIRCYQYSDAIIYVVLVHVQYVWHHYECSPSPLVTLSPPSHHALVCVRLTLILSLNQAIRSLHRQLACSGKLYNNCKFYL